MTGYTVSFGWYSRRLVLNGVWFCWCFWLDCLFVALGVTSVFCLAGWVLVDYVGLPITFLTFVCLFCLWFDAFGF